MHSATAFLFGFGAFLLLWIAAEVSWPLGRELKPTPEKEIGLYRKKNPWRFWLFRTTRFCFPGAIELWIDLVRACRKKEDIEKERNEGRYS
jgi:hypothetical protein